MLQAQRSCGHVVLSTLMMLVPAWGAELSVDELVESMANRLERTQVVDGAMMGSWASEEMFTGPITSGLASAYEWTDLGLYRIAANWGGYYILRTTDYQGNLLGDEAYAFVRLSEIFPKAPDDVWTWDVWKEALEDFYFSPRRPGYEESTAVYLDYFADDEPSTTAFLLAHHVVAVYYADDIDKEVWRDVMIQHLSRVDDNASFPVMALGAATWAMATIGHLNDTPVTSHNASSYWDGVVLSDLPVLLLGHQVPEGEPFAGSFYWRFDHTAGGAGGATSGYTEDAIFGTVGLVEAALAEEDPDSKEELEVGIAAAHEILLEGIGVDGQVYEHLSRQGATYHAFAGEMLQALWRVKSYWGAQEASDRADQSGAVASSEADI
jgi:hypothetical protein